MNVRDITNEKKEKLAAEKVLLDRRFTVISVLRVAAFLAAVILCYMGFYYGKDILVAVAAVLAILFIYLVRVHESMNNRKLHIDAQMDVLSRYVKRTTDEWHSFEDKGEGLYTAEDTVVTDLDLIGPNSLYQMISIAHTDEGRSRLAEVLRLTHLGFEDIADRREAIGELSEKFDFLVSFEAATDAVIRRKRKLPKRDDEVPQGDESAGDTEAPATPSLTEFPMWMMGAMILVPLMNILAICLVIAGVRSISSVFVTFMVGLMLTWVPMGSYEVYISFINQYGIAAGDYHRLLSMIADEEFISGILSSLRTKVTESGGLLGSLVGLSRLFDINSISFNPIVHMLLSGFLGWDYYMAYLAYRWNKKHEGAFDRCEGVIAEFEELSSLAVLPIVRRTSQAVVTPTVTTEGSVSGYADTVGQASGGKAGQRSQQVDVGQADVNVAVRSYNIVCENIYHPLISTETVVPNSAEFGERITVITGSNMSGKTTFLRTVAINMVLSYIGAAVCADRFEVPYMKIFTSMRVTDDVAGGISTFYAEILRIKSMTEYIARGESVPAMCFIDEIFKGTNSADRIVGATEAIRKLSEGNSMVMVSTHDFELCDMKTADGVPADNRHFEEHYVDDKLSFDYRIKDGRCTTRNAMAILRMAGLVGNSSVQ